MKLFNRFQSALIPGLVFLLFFTACSKKSDDDPVVKTTTVPVVTTSAVTAILDTTATCGGTITSDGGDSVVRRGICWSLSASPQITDHHTVDGAGKGSFTSIMTGLVADTLYYARAYASNGKGTAYGNIQSFRTMKTVVYQITDIDGNIYHAVKIGLKSWLRENLRVTRYRTGDTIPVVALDTKWKALITGARCSYENLSSNSSTYGYLYNWHASNDSRGICPTGWHVPSEAEWTELANSLGGSSVAGGLMKTTGTIEGGTGLWYAPNTDATNSSGFTGLPGGYRINYGTFYSIWNVGYFWSSSDTSSMNAWNYILDANNGELNHIVNLKTNGMSVRCCKDW
ncbi:MAG: fibrobacter succinogenes major paralogous domain-containing protein [Bacteroidetes bacterium]|nr:fibrobacter succinogenes major paralogous domain-containing protein [Bacteroidota bacterium]